MNALDDIVRIVSKEVKEEDEGIRQVTLVMISAWTKNPQNLRILAPSGEGKTYLVTKIANLFPQDNVIILQNATAQSFKYYTTKKVVEINPGEFEDYQTIIEQFHGTTQEKNKRIKEIQNKTYDLVDLQNKVLVFVDSQSFRLWESLKSVLSHDQKNLKSFSVNKSKSGSIESQKIVHMGHPAVIYCSAKDEQALDQTNEINTRFNTISLNADPKKYRKMLELAALRESIPESIYQEEVISNSEREEARKIILGMVSNAQKYEIINPFAEDIQKRFTDDAGYKTRQLNIFLNNVRLHTLANAYYRPKFEYKDGVSVISNIDDVNEANKLTKKPTPLPPAKIRYFNQHIRKILIEDGREVTIGNNQIRCLSASEMIERLAIYGITDRKKLQETHLKPLVDYGYLEEFQDPDSRNRYLYSLSARYLKSEAGTESTLFDNIDVDVPRVKSFIDKYITRRLGDGQLEGGFVSKITPDDLLDEILNRQDESDSTHENSIVNSSKNVEGEKP
jgi:hypothetical protein